MRKYSYEPVTYNKEVHDYTVCDVCGKLIDVSLAIKGRHSALEDKTDEIIEQATYITIDDDDFVQHFCMKCARDRINGWLGDDHCDESITISMNTGMVLKSVFDQLKAGEVISANKKKEDALQRARILDSIKDGSHPIIQAEEEMLNRLFVDHPPEGRGGDNDG